MKNITIWILVFAIVGGGVLWWKGQSSSNDMTREAPEESSTYEQGDGEMKEDKYIEYTSGMLDNNGDKKRVLFFYANWCPVCRPADASFRKNESSIPDGMVVVRVNYNDSDTDDEEKALAKKYAVSYQHTYVLLDSQGNELKRWNFGEIQELLENVNM